MSEKMKVLGISVFKIFLVLIGMYTIANVLSLPFIIYIIYKEFSGQTNIADPMHFINTLYEDPMNMLILGVIQAISVILTVFIALKIEKRSWKEIGLVKINWKHLMVGLILGILGMSVIFIVFLLTGNIVLSGKLTFSYSILTGLILFIFVAFNEELLFRGYIMTELENTKNKFIVISLSSILFAIAHAMSPNVSILGLFNIALVGIVFAYMFIKTKNLWMPIGYHLTWNYFQGNIFGFPVSGTTAHGIFNIEQVNENILTGGSFGPEAGILTTIINLSILVGMYFYFNKRKQL